MRVVGFFSRISNSVKFNIRKEDYSSFSEYSFKIIRSERGLICYINIKSFGINNNENDNDFGSSYNGVYSGRFLDILV